MVRVFVHIRVNFTVYLCFIYCVDIILWIVLWYFSILWLNNLHQWLWYIYTLCLCFREPKRKYRPTAQWEKTHNSSTGLLCTAPCTYHLEDYKELTTVVMGKITIEPLCPSFCWNVWIFSLYIVIVNLSEVIEMCTISCCVQIPQMCDILKDDCLKYKFFFTILPF